MLVEDNQRKEGRKNKIDMGEKGEGFRSNEGEYGQMCASVACRFLQAGYSCEKGDARVSKVAWWHRDQPALRSEGILYAPELL